MKQFLVSLLFVGSLFLSSAEETFKDGPNQIKIISVSQAESKFIINPQKLIAELEIISISREKLRETRDGEIDFNASADSILQSIVSQIFLDNGDPAELDDSEVKFEYKPLLITYSGTLQLTKGFIQDLSTVSRRDDATITYSLVEGYMKVSIPGSFKTLVAGYNFEMNVRGDTVDGVLYSWVEGVTADYNVKIESSTMTIISTEFSLNIGSLEIDVYSSSISNSYKNLINELTENLMRETVLEQINIIVGEALNRGVLSVIGIN